jgi:Coenzyme PQQ synthesis protein D (PqqD)
MIAGNATELPRVRARGVVVRSTDRFVMVMGPTTADPLKLEGLAHAVWDALDRPRTTAQLTALIAARHGLEPDQLGDDIEATLHMLEAAAIVVEVS